MLAWAALLFYFYAMAKTREVFICSACGAQTLQWRGQCPGCHEWNTLQAAAQPKALSRSNTRVSVPAGNRPVPLQDVAETGHHPYPSGIASLDHYSKGAVCEWIFSRMCGIRVAGENRFDISPVPGGTLRSASLTYRSVYGSVGCRWERTDDGKTVYTLEIPANTQADFTAPGIQKVLPAGSYRFEVVSPEGKTLEGPAS